MADDAHQIKIDPDAMNLEKVNDHCLLYIMSNLTLMDAINLGKTSTRMQSAGQLYYRKFTKFSFGCALQDPSINDANLPVILEAIGKQICSIDWTNLTAAQFELLVKHCPNVTEFKLTTPKRDVGGTMCRNKNFFINLKKLYIESSNHIVDRTVRVMMSGRKLRTLDVQGCIKIRGSFFNTINHGKLKTVKIIDSPRVEKKFFNLSQWKGQLTTFASDTCCCYVEFLALSTEKLERIKELHLDMSCFKGITWGLNFTGLKKLKKLILTRKHQYNFYDSNVMINELAQIDSLELLNIQGITVDSNTIQALRSLKNLKYLRMDRIDNKIGRNLYELVRQYLSTLQELSIHYGRVDTVMGKPIFDMIAGMSMLRYFSHSSINWEWLDGIRSTKSITVIDEKSPLKIGVPEYVFNDPKKVSCNFYKDGKFLNIPRHK